MKNILLTGGTGFVGRNVLPILKLKYEIFSPARKELHLENDGEVSEYLRHERFDAVIHCANPNPAKNELDRQELMLENSLRIFMNLYQARKYCGKLIYIGSGAEYDKIQDICGINEEKCFRSVPKDNYGFAKYIMNSFADKSENIYNLCLFACYGPGDDASKFITHCIRCCLGGKPITIRQDCRFDYLHVYDLAPMVIWLVENDPQHHIYNACSGKGVLLSEIAQEVCRQMGNAYPIQIIKTELNKEYTCNNGRFTKESGIYPLITLSEGIKMQINWEKQIWQEKA